MLNLDKLLQAAREIAGLDPESAARKRAWLIGELLLECPGLRRQEVRDLYDRVVERHG
ncbi:hypothetical protein [Segnochrobactrum spirostomi]|uniref:hypothetical protein n=1 Tax=Segnochrobactrum spirostomi TaxID=2608987 RepID=UPI00129532DD|nr:hypothetical protein [Segnochrobactrum spirostomi]